MVDESKFVVDFHVWSFEHDMERPSDTRFLILESSGNVLNMLLDLPTQNNRILILYESHHVLSHYQGVTNR